MNATPIGTRWQIVDGPDLIVVWIDAVGFHSQRICNFNTDKPMGHAPTTLKYDDLIPASEGQKTLLI